MSKWVYSDAHRAVVGVLESARKDAGLRQEELAAKLGKSQSYISRIETGQRRVGVLEFYALARAMGADPTALFAELVEKLPDKIDV